ncbi:hypothetical protein Lalb_Chr22g0359341 [Lupinus albus]|uniref:Uncharacterized protein n=1 Tax=Lupinus albus TaxID=3870 RepID=A0A6A4N9V3_LUPAL|nr:hypothetical protein Lalb_Chr22g0359341 [Lupinus albus]
MVRFHLYIWWNMAYSDLLCMVLSKNRVLHFSIQFFPKLKHSIPFFSIPSKGLVFSMFKLKMFSSSIIPRGIFCTDSGNYSRASSTSLFVAYEDFGVNGVN